MTQAEQIEILRRHVLLFIESQKKANSHLQAIVEIGLLENDGNPLESRILGEDHLLGILRSVSSGYGDPQPGEISDLLDEARKIIDFSGHII